MGNFADPMHDIKAKNHLAAQTRAMAPKIVARTGKSCIAELVRGRLN